MMRALTPPSAAAAAVGGAPQCRVPAKATVSTIALSSSSPLIALRQKKSNRRFVSLRPVAASSSNDEGRSGGSSSNATSTLVEERPTVSESKEEGTRSTEAMSSLSSPPTTTQATSSSTSKNKSSKGFFGLGDLLGPIGLTIGGSMKKQEKTSRTGSGPIELGPIGMTVGASSDGPALAKVTREQESNSSSSSSSSSSFSRTADNSSNNDDSPSSSSAASNRLSSLSTEEWRAKYEPDGCVDLWVEEEFNAGSRLVGGRAAYLKGPQAAGAGSGEGRVLEEERTAPAVSRTVKIFNKATAQAVEVSVPEDRYVLWEAEDQGLILPYACRMGCCTACAVRVKEGEMSQPEALGVAAELRDRGFALMCVGFAKSDLVLELAEEDEVYDLQFGDVFESRATDPSRAESVERDPFALEIANMDE